MTIAQLADKFFASGEWNAPQLARSTCTRCGRSLTPLVFANHSCGDVVRDFVLVIPLAPVPAHRRVFRTHSRDAYRESAA